MAIRYVVVIKNIDNRLDVGLNGHIVFPREGQTNFFHNDPDLDIEVDITDSLNPGPNYINRLRFTCFNGQYAPGGPSAGENPSHLRYFIYKRNVSIDGTVTSQGQIGFNNLQGIRPANSVTFVDEWEIVKDPSQRTQDFIFRKVQ